MRFHTVLCTNKEYLQSQATLAVIIAVQMFEELHGQSNKCDSSPLKPKMTWMFSRCHWLQLELHLWIVTTYLAQISRTLEPSELFEWTGNDSSTTDCLLCTKSVCSYSLYPCLQFIQSEFKLCLTYYKRNFHRCHLLKKGETHGQLSNMCQLVTKEAWVHNIVQTRVVNSFVCFFLL